MRVVSAAQVNPLFIQLSFLDFILISFWNFTKRHSIIISKVGPAINPDYSQGSITGGASCDT